MQVFLFGVLLMTLLMVTARRITALLNSFILQSFLLFLCALWLAVMARDVELYIVAGLVLLLKVIAIPYFLRWMAKKIDVSDNLGLYINPMLSLLIALFLTYLSYLFTYRIMHIPGIFQATGFVVSISVTLIGLFIMIFRMKAITQIIGLLVMENGLFLAAVAACGGMPFFVDIAIFFDVFVCVIILGIFVYKINELFTHIDVAKLTKLRG